MLKQFYFKQFSLSSVHSLDVKTVPFQAIQFSICMQFSFIWTIDRTLSEWTWEWWQWRGTSISPKLQHYWNLTIRLFSVRSRDAVGVFYSPSRLDQGLIWVCHTSMSWKKQSMKWKHWLSGKERFCVQQLVKKVIMIIFWDMK